MKKEKNGHNQVLPSVIFLIVVTLLNVIVFYGSRRNAPLTCSTDSLLEAATLYLAHNGLYNVDHFIPKSCQNVAHKVKVELRDTITKLTNECHNMTLKLRRKKSATPLITLFTTHAAHTHADKEKYLVHNNTLLNWGLLKPNANLILFSNDSTWSGTVEERGWEVIRIAETETPPLLKDMFEIARSKHDTPWYGYVNADILFTSTFMQTLESISGKFNGSSDRVLLTGRRLNVEDLSAIDAMSDASLRNTAKLYGQLYREDAEDFFIVSKIFPWKRLLPVVVGIPGYDNWLVAEARCRLNATVIDVTETLEAVHQTTKSGGNREGHSHARASFNLGVFKKANVKPNFIAGLTECIEYRTYRTFCDTVDVAKRTNLGSNCNCKRKR